MRKILCLMEDYNELLFLETFLKKIGFDVLSTQKYQKVEELSLGFAPALFIVSFPFKGAALDPLLKQWRKSISARFNAPILALAKPSRASQDIELLSLFDASISSPIQFKEAIEMIASLLGHDVESMIQKWQNLRQLQAVKTDKVGDSQSAASVKDDMVHVSGKMKPQSQTQMLSERAKRYSAVTRPQSGQPKKTVDSAKMKAAIRRASVETADQPPSDEEMEKQAELFLEALMSTEPKKR